MSHLGAAAPVKRKGHPVTTTPEYPDKHNSDSSTTDTEQLFQVATLSRPPIPHAGKAIPCQCPVCAADLPSGVALYHHLWSEHLSEKSYMCHDCSGVYNNLKDLSSH